jgi:hypothetical protein
MTEAEAKEMMDAIEDCERVDPNEW